MLGVLAARLKPSAAMEEGLFDKTTATYYLDLAGGPHSTAAILTAFHFGNSAHAVLPVIGDWNGDGRDDLGVFDPTNATFFLDSNGNNSFDSIGDAFFVFGLGTDTPISF